jgi:lysyl-tRNA synthetase class 2
MLRTRARMLARVRRFFERRGILEVETPIASAAATPDPMLESLRTAWAASGPEPAPLWLHTSPEFPMKRLLAAGSGPIYQVCKVFRDGERGRLHHPEFTLLEWYRPGWGYEALMDEVADLVRDVLGRQDLPVERFTYRDLFRTRLAMDCGEADPAAWRRRALSLGVPGASGLVLDAAGWRDLLLTHAVEPGLGRGRLSFVCDYPPDQASLARIRPGPDPVAERFELYLEGMELANGFRELTDAVEQRRRFRRDLELRRARGQETAPLDERFLAALAQGMPEASGVALGLDRLLMAATGCGHIDRTLTFPVERA